MEFVMTVVNTFVGGNEGKKEKIFVRFFHRIHQEDYGEHIHHRERKRERERGERKRARYSDSGSIAARNVDERAWQAGCKGWKGSGAVRRSAVWSREVSRGWKRCERIGRCAGKRRKDVGVRAPTPLTSPRGEG